MTMNNMKTPGMLYVLRQEPSTLFWQVVPVDTDQGESMRRRGEPHVYDTSAQAHAVRLKLNLTRGQARQVVHPRLGFDDTDIK
jgi:hypothetical protein